MGISCKVGTFALDTTKTAGQDQVVTGVGFQGKAAIFWWSGTTSATDATAGGTARAGMGLATSSSNRYSYTTIDVDAQATTDVATYWFNDNCITLITTPAAAIEGIADFKSFDADGFTLTIDNKFDNAYIISYMVIGGTDLTNVYCGTGATKDTTTGNQAYTGVGFAPDFVMFVGTINIAAATVANSLVLGVGFTNGTAAANNEAMCVTDRDIQATTEANRYMYGGECLARGGVSGVISARAILSSFDADGFTLNYLETSAVISNFIYLCLKGGTYTVGNLLTQTDTTTTVTETVSGTPRGIFMMSHNTALNTQDTLVPHASMSIGAANSTASRVSQGWWSEDNLADSETAISIEYDEIYTRIAADDSSVGNGDITAIDAAGFTFKMDDADPDQAYVAWWTISDAAAAGRVGIYGRRGAVTLPGGVRIEPISEQAVL